MAYFDCIVGGASGDGVALIIECDPSFAGSVITADNGEDVFTDTCPSVAPYTVKFDGIPTGTYTISGVSGGTTITKQFTVLDYTTSLHPIPVGATVTPVNDIQTWLHCADIWDKTYTTIAQVLADASTLQVLIASNNAADYMARSTSWASSVTANANAMAYIGANNYCANKLLANSTWCNAICNSTYFESVLNVKIPTMTSNTTPSGTVAANSYYETYYPWKAFDGNESSGWASYVPAVNDWVSYDFAKQTLAKKIRVHVGNFYNASQFKIQGSNNNSTWTDLKSQSSDGTTENSFTYIISNNNAKFRYYRLILSVASSAQSNSLIVYTLQLYCR